ncbi:hypothetical protein [Amycolatopsis sp. CA-230715]|uniref:hypothetical protein n=1 Tax=Amycolatopsis sp. CA-230715 TaxID=2745196 RepID=UPI001C02C4C5|nr:hypothetical protein [Amycolatopsis sp. CA-230715]QWF78974.1 hypothetical protein HUW46_02374 [Amycolatopsis sp. CA-230715]
MRRITGTGSTTAFVLKPLLALALLLAAAFAVAPAAATAAPAHPVTTVAAGTPAAGSWHTAARTDGMAAPAAVFSCNYSSVSPFQVVNFSCRVNSGVAQVFLICSNGARINSGPLRAVNTYNFRLTCPGVPVSTINWESLG